MMRGTKSANTGLSDTTREALKLVKDCLRGKTYAREHPMFDQILKFITRPGIHRLPEVEKDELSLLVRGSFGLSEKDLLQLLSNIQIEEDASSSSSDPNLVSKLLAQKYERELWELIPKGGYFENYARYTEGSEAPLAYHFFCALVGIGLLVNRKVYFNMGYYRLYPPLAVFLLGPSGLKKTSAANILVKMVQEIEITKVFPEKLTPEVLVAAIQENPQGLLYGPEMASTLGKAKYLEHMVPLLTRVLDCPDTMLAETIGRGKELLNNVAISILMCSTPDWFVSNTPADTFGGGFIARNIMVMQNETCREWDIPEPSQPALREDLIVRLINLTRDLKGEMMMSTGVRKLHKEWYHHHLETTRHPEHALLGTYYQRKPDHMKRVAMCLHMMEQDSLEMTAQSLDLAIKLMDWIEQFIPPMLQTMFRTQIGEQHEWVLSLLRNNGGMIRHSELVRKVQHKLTAQQMRGVISSLREADQVWEIANSLQHIYILKR